MRRKAEGRPRSRTAFRCICQSLPILHDLHVLHGYQKEVLQLPPKPRAAPQCLARGASRRKCSRVPKNIFTCFQVPQNAGKPNKTRVKRHSDAPGRKIFPKNHLHKPNYFCYAHGQPRGNYGTIVVTGVLGTVSGGLTVKTKMSEETNANRSRGNQGIARPKFKSSFRRRQIDSGKSRKREKHEQENNICHFGTLCHSGRSGHRQQRGRRLKLYKTQNAQ